MASWQGVEVRRLRCRLGWSRAEMARRLGCCPEKLAEAEKGQKAVESSVADELDRLQCHVEAYAFSVKNRPLAEALMKEMGLSQLEMREVVKSRYTGPAGDLYNQAFPKSDQDNGDDQELI